MNTFLLLTIAAAAVLLIVEGAFLARWPAEKIHALLRRSILVALALVTLTQVVLGAWHWLLAPAALLLPFIDHIYAKLRAVIRKTDFVALRHRTVRQLLFYWQRTRTLLASAWAKARTFRAQKNNSAARYVDMTRDQALSILGLSRSAGPHQIKDAHRRLMRTMHPDRGGTSEQAAQINRAKDVLTNPRNGS